MKFVSKIHTIRTSHINMHLSQKKFYYYFLTFDTFKSIAQAKIRINTHRLITAGTIARNATVLRVILAQG